MIMMITTIPLTDGTLWLSTYTKDNCLISYEYEGYEVEEAKEDFIKEMIQQMKG